MAATLTTEVEDWFMSLLGYVPAAAKVAATTTTSTTSANLGIGITSDVGAVAGAISAGAGLAKQIDAEVNTPAEIAAAEAAQKQALADQMCVALANNDTATIQKLIAGK